MTARNERGTRDTQSAGTRPEVRPCSILQTTHVLLKKKKKKGEEKKKSVHGTTTTPALETDAFGITGPDPSPRAETPA